MLEAAPSNPSGLTPLALEENSNWPVLGLMSFHFNKVHRTGVYTKAMTRFEDQRRLTA